MGGYGSGCRFGASPKTTVEDCLILSAAKLQRDRLLGAGLFGGGHLTWTRVSTGERIASIDYRINTRVGERPTIWLNYTVKRPGEEHGEGVDHPVSLTTTPLPWGAVRWWLVCPLTVNCSCCGRRVGKLYLPPGGRYFGCRRCYDLTYQSTRDSNLAKYVARVTGYPASDWRAWGRLARRAAGDI